MSTKTGVAAIADEVIGDVQKEADSAILNAENQAKETLRNAKGEADQAYSAILLEAKVKTETEKRKIASVTEVDARNRLLQTKEEVVDEAFQQAFEKLKVFTKTTKYHSYLVKSIEEIAQKIGHKALVVTVNPKDKEWLTVDKLKAASKKLGVELQISPQTEGFIGGCKVHSADGKIVFDGTLDNRLAELKPELRVQVAKQLFGGKN